MERFTTLMGSAYLYTEKYEDIPTKIKEKISKVVTIDFANEKFVCACWMDNFVSKGQFFVVLTDKRVIAKDPIRLEQNTFKNVTGVEQDIFKNIVIRSAGNSTNLFHFNSIPSKLLISKLLDQINKIWMNRQSDTNHVSAAQSEDVFLQIEKLSKLKDAGIITESEFDVKKTELLKRI